MGEFSASLFTDPKLYRSGSFKRPLFTADGITCNGVETVDGTKYYADKVVLAAGAWSSTLIDLEDQCVSKVSSGYPSLLAFHKIILVQMNQIANYQSSQAWVFAHIQLTPEEVTKYKNIPVVYDGEYGFFFEPNE